MHKPSPILWISAVASMLPLAGAMADQNQTILTDHPVELRETISPQGFVHPGISCDAKTLAVMRDKVIKGVSPWVDYFEGLRRTPYADLKQRPRLVRQITNDAGIAAFAQDAQLAWGQTILYVVTGNEEYRKTPLEIIRWYGSRTDESFFPTYFTDSHIKIGKYVYTLCSAVDILRSIKPRDARLAVTEPMVDALQKYCFYPIRMNCIQNNGYFMNQHTYAIMGYLASAILGNEIEDYRRAVEWTTVNATAANQGRNGSIKQQIRLVIRNDKTGEPVEPHLQVVEMGRDQAHAGGDIDNLLMMCKTITFQGTKVDPVTGAVTTASNGVSPIHFLDDRLPKGAALFAKYNLGYDLPWAPTWSETAKDNMVTYDQISYFGQGLIGGNGYPAGYYFYKGIGLDMDSGLYRYIKAALNAGSVDREQAVRSGRYINQLHNYAFDFWIGLPASASDAAPDPEKAKRALAVQLPPLKITRDGLPVDGQQFEFQFMDLSAHAMPGDIYPGSPEDKPLQVSRDADGTGYVRMTLDKSPRTLVAFSHFPRGSGLRVRSNSFVKLSFYRQGDFSRGSVQELYVPDTKGKWNDVLTTFDGTGLEYIQATPLAGPATIDFDRVDPETPSTPPLTFGSATDVLSIPSFVGANIQQVFSATGGAGPVTYSALNLPAGAKFVPATGALSWTPSADQVGDHTLYVTAKAGDILRTLRVDIH
ncbi:MAG TPA: Ig domain-containing protein, partial [Chthoniobacterales bacterium]